MSNKGQEKALLNPNPRKCLVCQTYQRKIDDVEQSLSGRDAIISILQTRLKKCETNYKNLFDQYEQLRFEHCTAMQDNFSLKEINAKLEEFDLQNNSNNLRDGPARICQKTNNPVIQEVHNIENLVATQNYIVQHLVEKIISELKLCQCDPNLSENLIKIQDHFKNIESGDHLDTDTKIQELLNQVESLKTVLDKYREENECMKKLLRDRKDSLSECQNILQDTSTSINKISSSIDDLVRDKHKKSKENCCSTKDRVITASNMDEQLMQNKIADLESQVKQKEKEHEACKCNMLTQMNDIADNNQILSDTLEIITAENRNNLEIVANLKEELRKANEECENKQKEMKSRIAELEDDLEKSYMNEKKLRETLEESENETKRIKERMSSLVEENATRKDCKCDDAFELKRKIALLECENEEMNKDIAEKSLELSEYEEENRALSQKIECSIKCGETLKRRIGELQEELYEKTKEPEKVSIQVQSADFSYGDLEKKVSQLEEDKRCLANECKLGQQERLMTIERLTDTIRIQTDEIEKLTDEKTKLNNEMERQKMENKKETDKLQAMVNHSQRQVELLLKEHDEKTAQIQNVATELDGIRRSVTEENNSFVDKIEKLERERDELKKKLEDSSGNNCKSEANKLEIEKLKTENCKKQCIIVELEKSIDTFNSTMKQFEQNIESMACENARLKEDKDKQLKDLEELQRKLAEKIMELGKIQDQLEQTKRGNDQSASLEKEQLRKEFDRLRVEQERSKRSSETEKLELQFQLEKLRKEEFMNSTALRGKLESAQKAYDELKAQCEKKCHENGKLLEDLQNSKKLIEELKSKSQSLQCECQKLKNQDHNHNVADCCDKMKRQFTSKSVENEDSKTDAKEKVVGKGDKDGGLKNKLTDTENELLQISQKYTELQNDRDEKSQELRKVKKQCDSCLKQSQITREEYNNLRREYKEIKSMLSEQIKKYRRDSDTNEAGPANQNSCKLLGNLKKQLGEKDQQIMALQQKLKDASYEVIELKDYIHKLISDNNILKAAINNLIGNLERKIKGPSFKSLPSNSADAIAVEILQSLTTIEDTIIKKSQKRFCPTSCTGPDCDCMSEIQSQYSANDPGPGTSRATVGMGLYPANAGPAKLCRCCKDSTTCAARQLGNICSDLSTTDSDEYQCGAVLDKRSVEFLKEAIKGLKTSKGSTMKEKSCDCEQL